MKKMSKLTALMLVFLMVFMLVPVSTFAMEEELLPEEVVTEETVFEEEVVLEEEPVLEEEAVLEEEPVLEEEVVLEEAVIEEVVETTVVQVEEPIAEVAATTYLALTRGGITIDVLANTVGDGYSFDAASSTLTLTNFVGEQLSARVFGEAFSLIFHGKNILGTNRGFAIDIDGDLHLDGSGELIAAGSAIDGDMGGGIRAFGDVVVDGGTYALRALAGEGTGSGLGLLAGNTDDVNISLGNLTINDGIFDIDVIDDGSNGAFGLFSFGDQTIHGGTFDISTYSAFGPSTRDRKSVV